MLELCNEMGDEWVDFEERVEKTDEMGAFVLRDKMTSEGKECRVVKQQTVAHKQDKEMC